MANIITGTSFNDNGYQEPALIGTDPGWVQTSNGPVYTLGSDEIYGFAGNDLLAGRKGNDKLYGGDGDDDLYGNEGDDQLYGNFGNDELYGNEGKDQLYGNDGNDHLRGHSGNDSLIGGNGRDFLGGGGSGVEYDILTGGAGADNFFLGVPDSPRVGYLSEGYALITDFNRTEGDKIGVWDMGSSNYKYYVGYNNWEGSAAQDTGIFYDGYLIGVVQDTTSVSVLQDFSFSTYIEP